MERARRIKAQQEAAARAAAEEERIRRIKAEEAAARAAEEERIRRIQAEQEAAARAAVEQERIRRLRAEQEAAARAAAEAERIRRYRAEQEATARAAAEAERIRRIKAEQEAVARAAAEQERIRRLRAEQEQLKRLREEQEARAAAEQERIRKLKSEQEAAAQAAAAAEQERLRQLRAQQEAAARLAEAERERLTHLRAQQEVAAIRAQYQNRNQPLPVSNFTSDLSYQPESNLGYEDMIRNSPSQPTDDSSTSLVDSARIRAEKEALAEQERLLRFQASQQALAQQQAAEQARLRRLRGEELLRAEEEREVREAQERQILRARHEQNQMIQAARDAATARNREITSMPYTSYTEDINKYPSNYSESSLQFGSLNNVRMPEPRRTAAYRSSASNDPLPHSEAIQPAISGDYVRRVSDSIYANQTSSSQLTPSRIASLPRRVIDANLLNSRRREAPRETTLQDSSSGNSHSTSRGHKPAKISLQELPPDLDSDGIPGVAGKDYPTLTEIPKTSFSCARQPLNGYYADTGICLLCQLYRSLILSLL